MSLSDSKNMDSFPLFKSFAEPNRIPDAFTINQKDVEDIQNDIASKSTTTKSTNRLDKSAKKPTLNQAAQCDICPTLLSGQIDHDSHIKGKKHQLVLKDVLIKNPQYKEPTYEELCLMKRELLTMDKQSKSSEDTSAETKPVSSLLAANGFICHLCNVICNSRQMFDDHINGKKHQTKVKLQSVSNPTSARVAPDNNPSSSNYCDVCSVQLSSETKLTEHLAQKRHQQRVKEDEFCAREAASLNINCNDYEISSADEKNNLFTHECTACNKKFGSKTQLIGHLKSTLHTQISNSSDKRRPTRNNNWKNHPEPPKGPATNNESFPTFRSSKKPLEKPRRPYGSQNFQRRPPADRTFNQQTPSSNIFGAFDPNNQYSMKRPTQSEDNSNQYDSSYSKRIRTYNNESYNSQYSYSNYNDYHPSSAYPQYPSDNQTYSSQTSNYTNQSSISQPPVQYSTDSYYNQQSSTYPTSNYINPISYPSEQPPLPTYEPPSSSNYPPPPSNYPPPPSHNYYARYAALPGDTTNNSYTQPSSNY